MPRGLLFTQGQRHYIHRTELGRAHLGPDPDAPARRAGAPGQARLRVQRFATGEESRADGVEPGRRRRVFSVRFLGDDMRHAPRPWKTSPDFPGLAEELPAGAPMEHPLFPLLWGAQP